MNLKYGVSLKKQVCFFSEKRVGTKNKILLDLTTNVVAFVSIKRLRMQVVNFTAFSTLDKLKVEIIYFIFTVLILYLNINY
jgi:hypothetical protein